MINFIVGTMCCVGFCVYLSSRANQTGHVWQAGFCAGVATMIAASAFLAIVMFSAVKTARWQNNFDNVTIYGEVPRGAD